MPALTGGLLLCPTKNPLPKEGCLIVCAAPLAQGEAAIRKEACRVKMLGKIDIDLLYICNNGSAPASYRLTAKQPLRPTLGATLSIC